MRTFSHILAVVGLAAFWSCATAQGVTQTNDRVRFTFTDLVTRVPVHLPLSEAVGVPGPNLICHSYLGSSQTIIGSAAVQARPTPNPADLRGGLLTMVAGKSASELSRLLAGVQSASGREAKVREMFGIAELSTPGVPPSFVYPLDPEHRQLLQMGQEVTPALAVSAGTSSSSGSAGIRCYTTQQIDQAIAEGTRVVTAIIQALSAPALPTRARP